jgi:hypothetical protein
VQFDSTLIALAIIVIGTPVLIAAGTYAMVNKMSNSPGIVPAPECAYEVNSSVDPLLAGFLQANDFRLTNAYRFHSIRFGDWIQVGTSAAPLRRLVVALSASGRTCEFITEFADQYSLTTTRSKAAFVFPRPYGSFMQSFPAAKIEHLWDQHVRGEQYLMSELAVPVAPLSLPFVEAFGPAVQRQMRCIKSLPLWPVRGIYWFLLKRFLMHNRPIWKQDVRSLYPVTA